MDIRIGIQHASREIVIEAGDNADSAMTELQRGIEQGTVVTLTDAKDRRVLIPGDKIAYAEFTSPENRRVGFLG